MWKNTFFLLASFNLLACTIASSQHTTSGYVLDGSSKAPLEGVSVYYDGTSIGTITDENGYFEIGVKETITASLVIGYIGFENRIFSHYEKGFLGNILLSEKAVQLNEVVLKPDTWNREKKLNIFKREFLGKTQAAFACRITNENDIRLY